MADDRRPGRRGPPGHGAAGRRWGTRAVLPAVAAAVLLALVAVGSLRGPLGSGRGRPGYPGDLIDSLLLLLGLAVLAAAVLAVVALWPDRHRLPSRRRRNAGVAGVLAPLALILLAWFFRDLLGLGQEAEVEATTTVPTAAAATEAPPPAPGPGVVPLAVAGIAVAVMMAIVVAQLRAERRRRRPPRSRAEQLVEVLDDTLDDLEREPDPRRAVIAAWARMERGLAAAGLPRDPAEAPFEYAARVLESALARPDSVQRLTGLFEQAKFSRHRIGQADRDQAIAALRSVRRELADAVERAAEERPAGAGDRGGR